MKTVTQNFVDAQKAPAPAMVRQVWYKRRYWVETSKSYAWESNWTQLTEDKVVNLSNITWQLDTQTLNEFKTSNVTLTLENLNNQWVAENPYGKFAKDTASPIYGYYPYWTKFQIRAGLNYVAAGATTQTTEVVNVFTGVATEYTLDSGSGAMQITLTGEEAILIGSNAESVSTTVTNEVATGSVDGSNKVFTTAHNGVGIISDVSDNGITKRAGTDYTISQLNDPSNPGKISFLVAPAAGHAIRVTYLYWQASQKFETLVTNLLNQAGIAGGNQRVSAVTFPSNIINSHAWQTQADWQGGLTLTDIDTTSLPNSIRVDYSGTDAETATGFLSATGWTTAATGSASLLGLGSTGMGLNGGPGDCWAYRASTKLTGRWEAPVIFTNNSFTAVVWIHFMFNQHGTIGSSNFYQGYSVKLTRPAGATVTATLALVRNDSATIGAETILSSVSLASFDQNSHTIRIVRSPTGAINVYYDGTLEITQTDTTYTTCTYTGFHWQDAGFENHPAGAVASNLTQWPSGTFTASWRSASVDFGSTPSAWSQFTYLQTLNGGSTAYYTRSSADNISFDSWVAVSGGGLIGSTLRRYLQTRADLTASGIANQDLKVANITAGSVTSSTVITLANFTGMTCYDAITALAKFANYEFGFDASENFFFRPKSPGNTPVFTLTETTFNLHIVSKVNGYDRVYSKIRASYAGYIKDISDDGLTYQGPLPRTGYALLEIDGGSILISSDADVATGLAGSFFNYYNKPRRRVKVQTKIIPQLDLSDVVNASLQDLFPTRWYIGDTSAYIGDTAKSLYGPDEQILAPLNMKVIGMRVDTNSWVTEFDLEEII